jgi:hypothetical protein
VDLCIDRKSNNADSDSGSDANTSVKLLLSFRSLTYLSIIIPAAFKKRYSLDITGPFIKQHWTKLDKQSIHLVGVPSALVHMFREFLSLSSPTTLRALTSTTMTSTNSMYDRSSSNIHSMVGMRLLNILSHEELNEFLLHMENASLLIPSSSLVSTSTTISISSKYSNVPIISLECTLGGTGAIQSLERDLTDRIRSREYSNLTIRPILIE